MTLEQELARIWKYRAESAEEQVRNLRSDRAAAESRVRELEERNTQLMQRVRELERNAITPQERAVLDACAKTRIETDGVCGEPVFYPCEDEWDICRAELARRAAEGHIKP
jgi:predicted nuclease with TOPRIM domain